MVTPIAESVHCTLFADLEYESKGRPWTLEPTYIVLAYYTFSILILSECKNLYSRSEDITFSPQRAIKKLSLLHFYFLHMLLN